jgi:hypothetical protein
MTRQTTVRRTALHASLESRLGVRIAAMLGQSAAAVPHDIAERLRVAREQAVARARESRTAQQAADGVRPQGGAAVLLGGPSPWWLRVATWLPLVLLVAGLVAIEQWTAREQVLAAAEIDAVLLTDELPPDAWADPGFREFLRSPAR